MHWRSPWAQMLFNRSLQAVLVSLLVGSLCFALMHSLPGDPAMRIAAGRYGPDAMSQQAAENVRQELGLDRPLYQQYAIAIGQLAQFNLGHSLVTGQPVLQELKVQLGYSIWLALTSLALSFLGIPIGLLAAGKTGGWLDQSSQWLAIALRSLPPFVLGLLLIWLFSIRLNWLPPAGFGSWLHMLLPSLTLALGLAALSCRVSRDTMAEVERSSYFTFAKHKGLSGLTLINRHGLRNTAIPIVTYLGVQTLYLIEGVVVVESIFAYPGIGHAMVHAIIARDVPMVQGTVLTLGLLFVLINLAIDACCRWLDPRQRTTA